MNAKGETTLLSNIAGDKIIEIGIPFSLFSTQPEGLIEFVVLVLKNGLQIENLPSQSSVKINRPSADFDMDFWSV